MLDIRTFDARQGGNVLYKALAHPLAAEGIAALYGRLRASGPISVVDPEDNAGALFALHPDAPAVDGVYVQDVRHVGAARLGHVARPVTDLPATGTALVAAFDARRLRARLADTHPGLRVATLDDARIGAAWLTRPDDYLDRLNFATNHVFFRDEDGLSTRLSTANYWSGYGAGPVRLWLRLFDRRGGTLASWFEPVPDGPAGFALDSAEIRARFGLPAFTGQLFLHAIGVAGHDVVKYALDTYANDGGPSLSCTHDANAWPSDRYAGLPAPREGERVILWLQNSHAAPIPAGAVRLGRMGSDRTAAVPGAVPAFATVAVDAGALLPGLRWPAQIELRTGRHVVRPRYEVTGNGRTRIAHVNVERADLAPDPEIEAMPPSLGRGFLLPFPILPQDRFATVAQPNPMAESLRDLPLRVDVFAADGTPAGGRFLGRLPRDHDLALDLGEFDVGRGHAELVYDFRDGGAADGWMHTLVRYEDRGNGHAAETSFGAHVYNTAMTWRDEPQSYAGPPPGLSTRLFLKLGNEAGGVPRRSFAYLIYAASAPWRPASATSLHLHDGAGTEIARHDLAIPCQGSAMLFPDALFPPAAIAQAGPRGYVLIRDATCRLFGYHGLTDDRGGFSLDHMFGF